MKVTYSGIGITDARGKLNGSYASKNLYGNFIGTIGNFGSPQTPEQLTYQNQFSQVTQYWRFGLTQAQRDDWDDAGQLPEWEVNPTFGTPYQPSGFQLFCTLNLNAFTESFPISDPPVQTIAPILILSAADMTKTGESISLNITYVAPPQAGVIAVIWTTFTNSTGIKRPQWSLFRQVYRGELEGFGNTIEIGEEYVNQFGGAIVGNKIWVYSEAMVEATGQRGTPGKVSAICIEV